MGGFVKDAVKGKVGIIKNPADPSIAEKVSKHPPRKYTIKILDAEDWAAVKIFFALMLIIIIFGGSVGFAVRAFLLASGFGG